MAQPTLTLRQLNRATLARQGLLKPLARVPVARLVERIVSLQAQHPDWPPLALQSRLPAGAPLVDLSRARVDALEAEGQRLMPILGRGAFSRYPGTD